MMSSNNKNSKNIEKFVFIINLLLTFFLILEAVPINGYHFFGLKIGIPFNQIWLTVTSFSILSYFEIKWIKYVFGVFILILPLVFVVSCSRKWEKYIPANYLYEIHFRNSILVGETHSLVTTKIYGLFEKQILSISSDEGNIEMNDSIEYSINEAQKINVQPLEDSVKITYLFKDNMYKSKIYKINTK